MWSFYIVPLDKAGKTLDDAKTRHIALLGSLMKLTGLILVRRLMPLLRGRVAEKQYAYRGARCAEVPQAHLNRFAGGQTE